MPLSKVEPKQKQPPAQRLWRCGVLLWVSFVLLGLGTALGTNIVIDPYNLTMMVTHAGLNEEIPDLAWQSRWSKAAGLIREHPETLLLGSSVVDHGFDLPGSTDFDRHRSQNLPELKANIVPTYNAG